MSLCFFVFFSFFFLRRGSSRVCLKFLYHGYVVFRVFLKNFAKKKERKEQESHLLL